MIEIITNEKEINTDCEIKNCPFCNGKTKLVEDKTIKDIPSFQIRCANIDCAIRPKTNWFTDKFEAIKRWNRRY